MASAISDIVSVQAATLIQRAAAAQRIATAQPVAVAQPANTPQPVVAAQPTDITTITSPTPTAGQPSLPTLGATTTTPAPQDLVIAEQSGTQLSFITLVQALQTSEQLTAPIAFETTRVTISEKGRQLAREAIIPVAASTSSSAILDQSTRTTR
jgi:hypothetical protein